MKPNKNKTPEVPALTRIALADDHGLFRAGIVSLLKDYPEFKIVLQASNGKELLDELGKLKTSSKSGKNMPNIILLDIEMPELNGIDTYVYLHERFPEIKVIILSMHFEEGLIFEMLKRGICGFLEKDRSVTELIYALRAVRDKGQYFDDSVNTVMRHGVTGRLAPTLPPFLLNEMEVEIIKLICKQMTTKEIAEVMNMNPKTTEHYRTQILAKTNTKNTAGLVVYALKNRLLTDFLTF